MRLYKKYIFLCPDTTPSNAFYLKPACKPTSDRWYDRVPVGHNNLRLTMTRLCKAAGIKGFKTNHSLRETTATRLYNSGVDEQLVMERTGHRSIKGVRNTSDQQRQTLSDILNCKQPRLESSAAYSPPQAVSKESSDVPYTPDVACSQSAVVACSSSKLEHTSSASQSVATCSSTNIHNNSKQNLPELLTLTTVHRLLLISTSSTFYCNIMSLVHITDIALTCFSTRISYVTPCS